VQPSSCSSVAILDGGGKCSHAGLLPVGSQGHSYSGLLKLHWPSGAETPCLGDPACHCPLPPSPPPTLDKLQVDAVMLLGLLWESSSWQVAGPKPGWLGTSLLP
jgi:hypothetical protein